MKPEIFLFENSNDAYKLAEKNARYGHRQWLVWKTIGGWKTAKLSYEVLMKGMTDFERGENGKPKVAMAFANGGGFMKVSDAIIEMWLRNMEAGTFCYA